MATTSEARALPFFTDLYGAPLESGSIYIGQAGLDPVAYPAVVTSDIAGSVVLQQPIRTVHGRATAAGALVHMFCPIPYSITILDSAGRLVYASLNETDPVAVAVSSSSVQSEPDLAGLRARSGSPTNQVWVAAFGMYIFQPNDTTSPENIPFVIVGNDGARYALSAQYCIGPWIKATGSGLAEAASAGAYLSWNEFSDGAGYLTVNQGVQAGGFVIRTVNAGNTAEVGRVTITSGGTLIAKQDVVATGVLSSTAGIAALNASGTANLNFDGTNYNLPGAQLNINGSQAVNDGNMAAKSSTAVANIMNTKAVGGLMLTTGATPGNPGTWSLIVNGVGSTGIAMWVRTA